MDRPCFPASKRSWENSREGGDVMRLALGARALVAAAILALLVAGVAQAVPPKKTPKLSITLTASAVDPTSGQYALTVTGDGYGSPQAVWPNGHIQFTCDSKAGLICNTDSPWKSPGCLRIRRFSRPRSSVGAVTARSKRSTTTTGSSRTRSKPRPAEHFEGEGSSLPALTPAAAGAAVTPPPPHSPAEQSCSVCSRSISPP